MLMGMGLGRMGGTTVNVDAQGRIILRTKATKDQVFAVDSGGGYNWAPAGLPTTQVDTDSLPEKQRGMYFWMTSHPDYQVADADMNTSLPVNATWEQIGAQDTASTGKWLTEHGIVTGAAVAAAQARGDAVDVSGAQAATARAITEHMVVGHVDAPIVIAGPGGTAPVAVTSGAARLAQPAATPVWVWLAMAAGAWWMFSKSGRV